MPGPTVNTRPVAVGQAIDGVAGGGGGGDGDGAGGGGAGVGAGGGGVPGGGGAGAGVGAGAAAAGMLGSSEPPQPLIETAKNSAVAAALERR
jgi:hypothetical protein